MHDLTFLFNDFKETNKRIEMEKMIATLNNELENMKESLKECLRNNNLNKNDIQV